MPPFTDGLEPDNRTVKELADAILTSPVYPGGTRTNEPAETFEQVLDDNAFKSEFSDLLTGTRAVKNITGDRPNSALTKQRVSKALPTTQKLRAEYAEFINDNRSELKTLGDGHEEDTNNIKEDITRSEQAIQNLDIVDALYKTLARKMVIELSIAQSR